MSREVVIVEAARTAIGRGHPEKGYYKDVHPATLLGHTYRAVIERSGIDPAEVEYVIAGCVQQFGEQSLDIARNAWLQEGYPIEASASTIDLQCGSGQQAVGVATALIASGVHDVVIGSGVEHMGRNSFAAGAKIAEEFGSPFTQAFKDHYNVRGQGIGAELIAEQWEIPRSELDQLAVDSHRKAAQATDNGWFGREIAPINGFTADQGIRPDTIARGAVPAQAGVQARRPHHRRQLVADLRRRRRGAADGAREGRRARPHRRARGSSTTPRSAATR